MAMVERRSWDLPEPAGPEISRMCPGLNMMWLSMRGTPVRTGWTKERARNCFAVSSGCRKTLYC